MDKWLLRELMSFAEENWSQFVARCEEDDIPETDIDEEFDKYQREFED